MVRLQEVEDEHFTSSQSATEQEEEEDDYTDTDSEISDDDGNDGELEESLYDRLVALKDIIPLKQRTSISNGVSSTFRFFTKGAVLGGKTFWVISTSALILGVPFAVAITDDQQLSEMEKEMKMNQYTADALTPGTQSILTQPAPGQKVI